MSPSSFGRPSRVLVALALGSGLGGCVNTFDPMLYLGTGDAGPTPVDAFVPVEDDAFDPVDAGEAIDAFAPDAFSPVDAPIDAPMLDGGPPIFALADYCTGEVVPRIMLAAGASSMSVAIDTRDMRDHGSAELTCSRETASGPDGFASVSMGANDRWHFHFRHVGDADPVLYVLPSCDVRLCTEVVADACNTGADEHLTVATGSTPVDYFLAIDTADAAGLTGSLEIIHPTCGNGMIEHSETCDGTARCGTDCRAELSGAFLEEANPNDDRFSANHILGMGPVMVTGRVVTPCEVDWFMIDVPEGADVDAELLTSTGTACGTSRPQIELDLFRESGSLPIATGIEAGGGACAAIASASAPGARNLAAGRYFLRVYALNDTVDRPFTYGLNVTVTP
ncbi:MAG: hypothetical protein J0L92_25755 [Deltaproteobacteria bacterium]|nr:hypothetical protein [Deltaproteobacteria bacterium]